MFASKSLIVPSILFLLWNATILRDPGAVIRAGLKGATKVFKHGRKSPWVPTLTILGDPGADSGGEGKSKRAEKYGT